MVDKAPLGFIGLGTMGGVMASRLIDAGHSLVVFDTSAAAIEAIVAKGAVVANPRQRLRRRRRSCSRAFRPPTSSASSRPGTMA